ncbi:MAG: S8 family serine peptidase, partial [Candidatus Cloacimonadaceae bacterium]|nr:S8 family serine peptidase [Candidatus Cloacimonadaceae bacterium]
NSLLNDPHIEYAEPIYIDQSLAAPNDPNYGTSLYFSALQAEDAWDIHKGELGSQPVILAVVDTGVRWTHPDLAENIWQNLGEDANGNGYTMFHNGSAWVLDVGDLNGIDDDGNGKIDDLIGWDFMLDAFGNQGHDPYESGGHGTSVSGIANSRTNNSIGVASLAWNVVLMPLSCSHPGAPSTVYRGYDAIIYAAENGADIINCSWGGTSFSQANQDAIDYAYALGSVIIAAAGNSNNSTPIYPAGYQNVVAVGSVLNDGSKTSVSNFGSYLSVSAPTQSVGTTSGSGYSIVNNATSYASPIASSLAALIKSYHPTWTNDQVVQQLVATCDNIDAMNPGKEKALGQGKLNAYRALSEINPIPNQELKLAMHQVRTPNDENNNRAIEPGETVSLNLTLRNFAYGAASNNVSYLLSCSDPLVTIHQNSHSGSIAADSYVYLDDAFSFYVAPTATSKYVNFTLHISADLPIAFGSSISFQMLINAGGIFVWEGRASGRDMSGAYIRNRLQAMSYHTTYGTS